MRVYTVRLEGFNSCTYDSLEDAIEEVKSHFENGDTSIRIIIKLGDMTKEEFAQLPEFMGY